MRKEFDSKGARNGDNHRFLCSTSEGNENGVGGGLDGHIGLVTMDFLKFQFKFDQGKGKHVWQGETRAELRPVCFQSLRRIVETNEVAKCYCLQVLGAEHPTIVIEQEEIHELIEEFQDIFQAPNELPPERAFDHAIHLEPLSKPVNVKPYCYPCFQKVDVEHQVQQLLEQ